MGICQKVWLKIKSFIFAGFLRGRGVVTTLMVKLWKGFLFTHAVPSQGWHFILSFCLSVNKTWNWLHTPSPHESQPLILSHSIWEEEAQKWLVWITFQMQHSCFKLNYCLSDVQHVVFLQFWSGILGNSPYIVISCKCLGTWWKGQQQWTHNGKASAGTRSHSE